MNNTKFRFELKLLEDFEGFTTGVIVTRIVSLTNLIRFPISKKWEVISCDNWTGKNDKNGVSIFVGDTVKHKFRRIWKTESHVSTVVWSDEFCCYYLFDGSTNHRMRDDMTYEVLKNITNVCYNYDK